ncbi:MAG: hypothetical protein QNJ51_22635 [Calothrix sp. MO_167.B12]|nr:hypothetical protein [Calothrix sp. MO_167.B12]
MLATYTFFVSVQHPQSFGVENYLTDVPYPSTYLLIRRILFFNDIENMKSVNIFRNVSTSKFGIREIGSLTQA